MLKLTIPKKTLFDERTNTFIYIKDTDLQLEHSLISISKWESKWHVPFMSTSGKTYEQTIDYIRCMTLTQNVDENVYLAIQDEHIEIVNAYINDPMTATTFNDFDSPKTGGKTIITAELIYYWMIALQIPVEFQKWHLNRLLTLIRVCNIQNSPKKNISQKDLINKYKSINEANRARFHSKG